MQTRKKQILLLLCVILACAAMAFVEIVLQPAYAPKSLLRISIFTGSVLLWMLLCQDRTPLKFFRLPVRKDLIPALVLAAATIVAILGGYAFLAPWMDLSAIPGTVGAQEGISPDVYRMVAFYVTFVNSMLEELFFRCFAFLTLRETGAGRTAWLFSSVAFAVYHVSIMDGWFSLPLLLLLTTALVLSGLLFCFLDRHGSLLPGWRVHMAADAALNVIGMRLFGIL